MTTLQPESVPVREDVRLIRPRAAALPDYAAALETGWSPANFRPDKIAREQLSRIASDPEGFLASEDDPEAKAGPVELPDGSFVARLPSFRRWVWDGTFCGSISLRWQHGTSALPPHVLGHIGFSIVPWKRGAGYATRALALLLPEAWALGLDHVRLTADPANTASQRVIQSCGGRLIGRFAKPAAYGPSDSLWFRIERPAGSAAP